MGYSEGFPSREHHLWMSDGPAPDADLAPCQRCGKDVVLDHDAPCPHGLVACPECTHAAVCADCKRAEERDAGFARCMAEPWTPHDLGEPETLPDALARQVADLERDADYRESVARHLDAMRARYKAWVEGRASE
jgi:hypothetical protein